MWPRLWWRSEPISKLIAPTSPPSTAFSRPETSSPKLRPYTTIIHNGCSSTLVTTRVTSPHRISFCKPWIDVTTRVHISQILVRPTFQCADPPLQRGSFQSIRSSLEYSKGHHLLPALLQVIFLASSMGRQSIDSSRPIMAPSVSLTRLNPSVSPSHSSQPISRAVIQISCPSFSRQN